jgi:hypothetical protein
MQKRANSTPKASSKSKDGASASSDKALPNGSRVEAAGDPIEAALASLLATESVWRKATLADIVTAHMPSIRALLERRCPVEKIAVAMIESGVNAKKATLVRAIQGVKSRSIKTPKKSGAASKKTQEQTLISVEPNAEELAEKAAYFSPLNDGDGPSDDEVREATDSAASVADILEASLSAS